MVCGDKICEMYKMSKSEEPSFISMNGKNPSSYQTGQFGNKDNKGQKGPSVTEPLQNFIYE